MSNFINKFRPALKAWVAAILPLIGTVAADWAGDVDIDARITLGALLTSTISFLAVYFTSNTTPEVDA